MLCCPQVHKFLNRVGRSGFVFFLVKKKKKKNATRLFGKLGSVALFFSNFIKKKKQNNTKKNATRPQHIYFFFGLIAHA